MEILTWSSGYMSLIFVLIYLVQTAWALCSECTDENIATTRTVCQSAASRLDDAEELKNVTLVCSSFNELFLCIGGKVPQCLEVFSEQYKHYTYTQWNCEFSNEQVMSYQKLVQNGCTAKSDTQTYSSALKIHAETVQFLAVLSGVLVLKNS